MGESLLIRSTILASNMIWLGSCRGPFLIHLYYFRQGNWCYNHTRNSRYETQDLNIEAIFAALGPSLDQLLSPTFVCVCVRH